MARHSVSHLVRWPCVGALVLLAVTMATASLRGAAQGADGSQREDASPQRSSVPRVGVDSAHVLSTEKPAVPARQRLRRSPLSSEMPDSAATRAPTSATSANALTRDSLRVQASRGGPVSVQVNLDGNGLDVVGDAGNEPSMAIDPTNPQRIVIGWRQFDTIASGFRQAGVGYSADAGASWTAPGVIDPGVFRSDPVLDVNSNGVFFYSSLTSDGKTFEVDMFRSVNGGAAWLPGVPAFGGDKQWFSVDRTGGVGAGHLYQHWSFNFSCCFPADFTRSTNGAASFEAPLSLPDPKMQFGTTAVGPDGTFFVIGSDYGFGGHVVARSRNAQNAAEMPVFDLITAVDLGGYTAFGGVNPTGLLGQTWIASDHSTGPTRGTLYVLSTVANEQSPNVTDVHLVRSVDSGATWSRPVRVNDDEGGAWHWFGAISVAPNGRVDATWFDTRNDPSDPSDPVTSELFFAYSLDQGRTWTPGAPVSPPFNHYAGYPQGSAKLGDYTHMISDNAAANLAYAATFTGGQDVYFVRIPIDCNQNGVEDPTDIAQKASADCNHNAIPDECEPDSDCNANQVRDICDIGAATSSDCNANLVPDECESQADCNGNAARDICDLAGGVSPDCNGNGVPDSCDIASEASNDRNENGVPDECQTACCFCNQDCFVMNRLDCLQAFGAPNEPGTICADVACAPPPANDQCSAAIVLDPVQYHTVPFDTSCATVEDADFATFCGGGFQPFTGDLWYQYQSPCDGELLVSLCSDTFFDSILAVYHQSGGCACVSGVLPPPTACGDDTCGVPGGPSVVSLAVESEACYQIRVGGWGGATGEGVVSLALTPIPGGRSAETMPYSFPGSAGDCNIDGHVRRNDQAGFVECMHGPDVPSSICCGCAEADGHLGNITLRDFAFIQNSLEPAAP